MPAAHRSALISRVLRNNLGAAGPSYQQMAAAAAAAMRTKRRGKILMPAPPPAKQRPEGKVLKSHEYDVFISHCGADTKQTVAALLYDRLVHLGLRPFLDGRTVGHGDAPLGSIDAGVVAPKVGIAVLSPGYFESVACLHELAALVESAKKLIPVFCDVKPSELKMDSRRLDVCLRQEELERFERALREARYTVGLTFDTRSGNWSDLVSTTVDSVLRCMREETPRGIRS